MSQRNRGRFQKVKDIWERFLNLTTPDRPNGCWLWIGRLDKDGYGDFTVSKKIGKVRAHRFAYEYARGKIFDGLVIDHVCGVRNCVNPYHLEPVTQALNIERCKSHVGKRTHCPSGHAYAGNNLIINSQGRRCCRACINERARKYREAKRVAAQF